MGKSELQYPNMKANIELCRKQLYALCRGERGPTAVMSVPPQETDFDMQFSAAFDELESARACVSQLDESLDQLDEVKRRINQAYWVAWARDFQEPGTPENERLRTTLQEVMLALKGEIPIRGRKDVALAAEWKPCPRCEARGCRTCEYHGASFSSDPCSDCENYSYYKPAGFCPECGRPLTGEAWTELWDRLRKIFEGVLNIGVLKGSERKPAESALEKKVAYKRMVGGGEA